MLPISLPFRQLLTLVMMLLLITLGAVGSGVMAPDGVGLVASAEASTSADPCAPAVTTTSQANERRTAPLQPFLRSELFFGTNRPDRPPVSDAEWSQFLNDVITRCFPDGLTVLTGDGQFRTGAGQIIRERSFLLILLHPVETRRASSAKIEFIREAYRAAFQQESVLRVDDRLPVGVAFEPLPAWAIR